jgi:hypothetical protein
MWSTNVRRFITVEEADGVPGLWLAGAPAADLSKAAQTLPPYFQSEPYLQSAFPYDHYQWISNAATAYAVMALAPAAAQN